MKKPLRTLILGAALITATLAPQSHAATPDEVDAAIKKGVAWLYARPDFQKNGNWEESPKPEGDAEDGSVRAGQWGGKTSLITYALLACGESPYDAKLKRSVDFLKSPPARITGTYALGLRAQVWLYLKGNDLGRFVEADYNALRAGIGKSESNEGFGLYGYSVRKQSNWYDLSASQYGVLGMWACEQLRDEGRIASNADGSYWQIIDRKWRTLQDGETGGWSYQGRGTPTPSMTAAGLATLFIAQDHLRNAQDLNCRGNQKSPEMDKAVDYLAAAIPELFDPGASPSWRYYTIYGVERVGVASGLKYFRDVDWYKVGADFLVKQMNEDGSWGPGGDEAEIDTAFALLFLARGREPVMMNKIKYDFALGSREPSEGNWNQRARDVANATRFTGRQTERSLNWQIIDLGVGGIADLHDAPIAYLSVSQLLSPTPEQVALLKQYVEEGGMLLFNRDCPKEQPPGPDPVKKLMSSMFPYEFKPLPEDHPILRGQQFRSDKWRIKPKVSGLSNGVREIALILEEDAGRAFQLNSTKETPQHFELMVNIYQYAIDKSHALVKGRSYLVERDPAIKPTTKLQVGRVQHGGNWDPEPGGWRRLSNWMHNQHKIDLQTKVVDLEKPEDLSSYGVLHLTGTGKLNLSPRALDRLKAFIAGGGTVVVDAAGGNVEFATSAEALLGKVMPAATDGGALVPPTDPVYAPPGLKPPAFRYRTFTHATVGLSAVPRVRGAKANDRYVVFYSSDDLSAGLVGNEVDGVRGYTPSTATEIMSRLLIYASQTKNSRT